MPLLSNPSLPPEVRVRRRNSTSTAASSRLAWFVVGLYIRVALWAPLGGPAAAPQGEKTNVFPFFLLFSSLSPSLSLFFYSIFFLRLLLL